MQWNCNGLRAHVNELKNFLASPQADVDILCLEETFLKKGNRITLPGYHIIRKDREDTTKGGLMIAVRESINYVVLEDIATHSYEQHGVKIKTKNGNIFIINGYSSPDKTPVKSELDKMFLKGPTIITGDYNAKHPLWGSKHSNKTGDLFEQLMDHHNYAVINTGCATRQDYSGNMSHLDTTFASTDLAMKCSWTVLNDSLGSDHLPTVTAVGESLDMETTFQPRFLMDTADWSKFKEQCRHYLTPNIISHDSVSSGKQLTEAIINAADSSIKQTQPPRKGARHRKRLPYWNEEIKNAVKARNQARNRMNKTKNPEDCNNYRRLKGQCQQTIKSTAKQHWQTYCSTLTNSTKLSTVWKQARQMNGISSTRTIPTLTANGTEVTGNMEKAELFADTFSQVSSNSNNTAEFRQCKAATLQQYRHLLADDSGSQDTTAINSQFMLYELEIAIRKAKKNSTPGEDRITYEMLQHLPKCSKQALLKYYNNIWSSGDIPSNFKHSIITPILKVNKNQHDPSSYRPICLTSTVGKIMERLVTDRLAYYLEKNHLITNVQTGFRKGRSTIDQIIRLQDEIHRNIHNGRFTLGVFIDFQRAFDMLWKDGVLIKLKEMGISGNTFHWINSFLSDRTIQVKVGHALSTIRCLDNGSPQGSPLSPLLFLVAINDLPQSVTDLETSLFADDSAIFKSARKKQLNQTADLVQRNLEAISQWCNKWGFRISTEKTVIVLFSKDSTLKNKLKPIYVEGKQIKVEKAVKFLGVYLDDRLTWKQHIDYIVKKCKARLNLMRSISGSSWGASKSSLMTIYRALIRSVMDYGAIAYDTATEAQKRRLDTIQYQALRIATGAMTSTSLAALQVESGETPLQLRRLEQQIKYGIMVKTIQDHPATKVINTDWKVDRGRFKPGTKPLVTKVEEFFTKHNQHYEAPKPHSQPPWTLQQPSVDIKLADIIKKSDPDHLIKSATLEKIEQYHGQLHIYTDGSKTDSGLTAAAFYIPSAEISQTARLNNHLSIYAAEIMAINMALQWVLTLTTIPRAVIFSDSLTSLKSLKFPTANTRTNWMHNSTQLLNALSGRVTLVWTPGHSHIHGNEIADQTAKAGTQRKSVDIDIGIDLKGSQAVVEKYIDNKWQEQWNTSAKGRHMYQIQPLVSRRIPQRSKSRRQETTAARLRLGKCQLNAYLHVIGRHDTGLCTRCSVPETIEHHLIECCNTTKGNLQQLCKQANQPFTLAAILSRPSLLDAVCVMLERRM